MSDTAFLQAVTDQNTIYTDTALDDLHDKVDDIYNSWLAGCNSSFFYGYVFPNPETFYRTYMVTIQARSGRRYYLHTYNGDAYGPNGYLGTKQSTSVVPTGSGLFAHYVAQWTDNNPNFD